MILIICDLYYHVRAQCFHTKAKALNRIKDLSFRIHVTMQPVPFKVGAQHELLVPNRELAFFSAVRDSSTDNIEEFVKVWGG